MEKAAKFNALLVNFILPFHHFLNVPIVMPSVEPVQVFLAIVLHAIQLILLISLPSSITILAQLIALIIISLLMELVCALV